MENKFSKGFCIGDRVMLVVDESAVYAPRVGRYGMGPGITGTICSEYVVGDNQVGVEWDDDIDGHDCQGLCEDGHGWFVYDRFLELVDHGQPCEPVSSDELFDFLGI